MFKWISLTILVIGLSAISWIATTYGILASLGWLDAATGNFNYDVSTIAIFFLIALFTILILISINYFFNNKSYLRYIFLTVYIFLTIVSVGFGYGYWWTNIKSITDVSERVNNSVDISSQKLKNIELNLQKLTEDTKDLLKKSTKKLQQEDNNGGSCDNHKDSVPSRGPIFYGREGISNAINSLIEELNNTNDNIKNLIDNEKELINTYKKDIKKLKKSKNIEELNTLSNDFIKKFNDKLIENNEIKIDKIKSNINTSIENLLKATSKNDMYVFDQNLNLIEERVVKSKKKENQEKSILHCSDKELYNKLTSLKEKFNELIKDLDDLKINTKIGSQSQRVLKALKGAFNSVLPKKYQYNENSIYPLSFIALALAFFTDFGIFILSFLRHKAKEDIECSREELKRKIKKLKLDEIKIDSIIAFISQIDNNYKLNIEDLNNITTNDLKDILGIDDKDYLNSVISHLKRYNTIIMDIERITKNCDLFKINKKYIKVKNKKSYEILQNIQELLSDYINNQGS